MLARCLTGADAAPVIIYGVQDALGNKPFVEELDDGRFLSRICPLPSTRCRPSVGESCASSCVRYRNISVASATRLGGILITANRPFSGWSNVYPTTAGVARTIAATRQRPEAAGTVSSPRGPESARQIRGATQLRGRRSASCRGRVLTLPATSGHTGDQVTGFRVQLT